MSNRILDDVQVVADRKRTQNLNLQKRAGVTLDYNAPSMSQIGDLVSSMNKKMEYEENRKKMSGFAKFLSGRSIKGTSR